MTMRAEKEDLKEAAEESYNVIMDLNLDGRVRWVSPSWDTVIGCVRVYSLASGFNASDQFISQDPKRYNSRTTNRGSFSG
jgi:hypothetical protein